MKKHVILFLVFLLYCISGKSQVVVELFTSEGCSSCPAADELLKTMSQKKESEGKPFIALAFHITYWNHLGWVDPYSDERYTDRQKKYAAILQKPQYYTPQVVVNGLHEFVGSDKKAFTDTLAKAERKKPVFVIEGKASQKGDSIEVSYSLSKGSKNYQLHIAVIERNTVREVTRGENKSRVLEHFNIVRFFKTVDVKEQDVHRLPMVKDLASDNMEIIVYVQHKKTLRIAGATKIQVINN